MAKTLIIAEKPSVANDLARVLAKQLGPFNKEKDYFESDSTIISSAIGHLVEQKLPTTADGTACRSFLMNSTFSQSMAAKRGSTC
jgi:DNA topoisomerase III